MKSTKLVAMMLALSLFACRGDDDGGDDGDDGDDTGDQGGGEDTSIYDVQSDDLAVGEPVTVRGVVVVAVDAYGGRAGGLYVMEPEGGPFSGVFVFVEGTEAAELAPGDIVDVVGGVKDEFALDDDETGRTLTEISPPEGGTIAVTKTGDGEVPAPETVVPWELAADDAESEKWEGVLVRFDNVRVNSPPEGVSSTDETLLEMRVTGPYAVQSALTGLADIENGACYSSIVGIGDYFFNYKILPRSADDLVAGADEDCLAPEIGDELCGDDTDNDYNGFADCDDFSCADASVACPTTETSVADIQSGVVEADTVVSLSQVIVTGVSFDNPSGVLQNRTFWVQDAAAGAENNGVSIFWPEEAAGELPPEIVVGRTVNLQGTVEEFPCLDDACSDNPLTRLNFATASDFGPIVPVADLIPLEGVDLATIAADPDSEPYEGVLVTLENVEVVALAGTNDFSIGVGKAVLGVDDVIFRYRTDNDVTVGQCFSSITGIVHRDIFGDFASAPILLPRSVEDLDATPGTCP